jgi:hypothetical protein
MSTEKTFDSQKKQNNASAFASCNESFNERRSVVSDASARDTSMLSTRTADKRNHGQVYIYDGETAL